MGTLDSWPETGTETVLPMSDCRAGGSAGNSALALAGINRPCLLISSAGNDQIGLWLTSCFAHIDHKISVIDCATTISTGIVHTGGERTFFTSNGHLEQFSITEIEELLTECNIDKELVLLSGVFLSPPLRSRYSKLIDLLKTRGCRLAIDPGWPPGGWDKATRREILGWFSRCDHVLINDKEAAAITMETTPERCIAQLAKLLPETTVVIKNGKSGALAMADKVLCYANSAEITPFDTIGAGDCFNAGYLHSVLLGEDLQQNLHSGVVVAAAAIASFPRVYTLPETLDQPIMGEKH